MAANSKCRRCKQKANPATMPRKKKQTNNNNNSSASGRKSEEEKGTTTLPWLIACGCVEPAKGRIGRGGEWEAQRKCRRNGKSVIPAPCPCLVHDAASSVRPFPSFQKRQIKLLLLLRTRTHTSRGGLILWSGFVEWCWYCGPGRTSHT